MGTVIELLTPNVLRGKIAELIEGDPYRRVQENVCSGAPPWRVYIPHEYGVSYTLYEGTLREVYQYLKDSPYRVDAERDNT